MSATNGGRLQVGIVVRDLASMEAFYAGLLGLAPFGDINLPDGGLIRRFIHGDAGLKLVVPKEPPVATSPPGGPTGGSIGLRYLTLEVTDVASTVARCEDAGANVVMPTFEHEGQLVAIVEDPEGNWVELIH